MYSRGAALGRLPLETTHPMRRYAIPALLALLLAGVFANRALAHANVIRSDPPAGATLASTPPALVLEFSEDADPSFTRVQLFNSARKLVNAGPGVIDATNPRLLRLALETLPEDSYTA